MEGSRQRRLGILGGTFNPIHTGHLILAQNAIEVFDLSQVLFVPCASPPHKDTSALAPAAHRLAMVTEAIEGNLMFEVSDVEIQRGGVSYAIDTVSALLDRYADTELCFIIGSDTLTELHLWRHIHSLLTLCRFVTLARPGYDLAAIRPADLHLDPPWPERLLENAQGSRLIDISSSDIRHRVAEGLSIRYLVPEAVEMYIAEHGLYAG